MKKIQLILTFISILTITGCSENKKCGECEFVEKIGKVHCKTYNVKIKENQLCICDKNKDKEKYYCYVKKNPFSKK